MSKIVRVKFLSSKDEGTSEGYYYKDELDTPLALYDAVLVPTRYGTSLAVVDQVNVPEDKMDRVQRPSYRSYRVSVSLSELKTVYEKIESKHVEGQMKAEKVKALKSKLEKEIKKIDDVQRFKVYAELSPEVATMLTELEELRA